MAFWERLKKWDFVFVLIFISALAYLPHINQFGYYRDDWYLMYSANALGGDIFQQIYAGDRPIRAYVMSLAYSLFNINPLYYNLSAYLFRVVGAFAFFITLQMIWKEQKRTNLLASVLFLIFPGFLSTPNAIDYQAQQFSLCLGLVSIALSTHAIFEQKALYKFLTLGLASFMSFIYLGLVEYFLGLEIFRLVVIFLISYRNPALILIQKIRQFFVNGFLVSAGTILFVLWRFFIFDSERKATDLGAQLNTWIASPLAITIVWARVLLKDIFEVTLLSWWLPLSDLWDISLRLREVLVIGIVACVVVLIIIFVFKNIQPHEATHDSENALQEMFWVGLSVVIVGFIPVILSNRDADLYSLSRYMLASSIGAVILVSAFMSQFQSQKVYLGTVCVLILSSLFTHYLNGYSWARSSEAMQSFWWQVNWRIPQLRENTTLVLNYSHTAIEEDYFIWGPANLMYRTLSKNNERPEPEIWGLVLNDESTRSILNQVEPSFLNRRSIITYMGYNNILILTQPSLSSCVQVVDGNLPIVSEFEQDDIQKIASESKQSNIILDESAPLPLEVVFGSEPEHEWCYYYQIASLAYQRGEYEEVLNIRQKAKRLEFSAQDPIEWMPFLQSEILLENYDEALEVARFIKKSPTLEMQVCEVLQKMPNLNEEMSKFIQKTFCIK